MVSNTIVISRIRRHFIESLQPSRAFPLQTSVNSRQSPIISSSNNPILPIHNHRPNPRSPTIPSHRYSPSNPQKVLIPSHSLHAHPLHFLLKAHNSPSHYAHITQQKAITNTLFIIKFAINIILVNVAVIKRHPLFPKVNIVHFQVIRRRRQSINLSTPSFGLVPVLSNQFRVLVHNGHSPYGSHRAHLIFCNFPDEIIHPLRNTELHSYIKSISTHVRILSPISP